MFWTAHISFNALKFNPGNNLYLMQLIPMLMHEIHSNSQFFPSEGAPLLSALLETCLVFSETSRPSWLFYSCSLLLYVLSTSTIKVCIIVIRNVGYLPWPSQLNCNVWLRKLSVDEIYIWLKIFFILDCTFNWKTSLLYRLKYAFPIYIKALCKMWLLTVHIKLS